MIDDLMVEIKVTLDRGEKVLVTTLTKRNAEDLTDYFQEQDLRVKYLHSDIDTVERIEILKELRMGVIDIIVGINLLREGLDLPEVSLVCIIDADKEGFLRSESALMQTIGRAARNAEGRVIMYANKETGAMKAAIAETKRRRILQTEYNTAHGITPKTIISKIKDLGLESKKKKFEMPDRKLTSKEKKQLMAKLELEMDFHAANLDFEEAAQLRDQIELLKNLP